MRFSVTYSLEGNRIFPLDYRAGFISLIKNAISRHDKTLFERYFEDERVVKPYVFAVRFSGKPSIENAIMKVGEKVSIFISTPLRDLGAYLYNGLIDSGGYSIYSNRLSGAYSRYLLERHIVGKEIVFKTLAPILVRHYLDSNKFIMPNENRFNESLNQATLRQYRSIVDNKIDDGEIISLIPIDVKKVVAKHYNGLSIGFTGIVRVSAEEAILNFVYQNGLGHRRSQGFGFLEVAE